MDFLFVIARVLFGGFFVLNGYNHIMNGKHLIGYASSKKVPNPKVAVLVSGLFILLGGLGIIFWTEVNLAVLLIVLFLVPVSFVMHNFWAEKDASAKAGDYIAFTKNIALIGGALAFLFI